MPEILDAWAEAEAAAGSDTTTLYTLEFHHSAFDEPVRVVNDVQNHDLLLEAGAPENGGEEVTFIACPFEFPWPDQVEGRAPELRIRVDNVGREITKHLDEAVTQLEAIQVIFRFYMYTYTTGATVIGQEPATMTLRSVTVTEDYVEGLASIGDIANRRVFNYVYNLEDYPGLNQIG
jgi:hypothetical protein